MYCGPNRHILYVLHLLCSHGALCSRSVRQLTAHLVRILSITFTRALKNNCIMGQNYFWSCILQFMFEGQGFHVSSWGLPEGFPRASLGLPEGLLRASWGVLQGFLGLPRGLPEGSLMISWGHWGCPEGFQRTSRGLPEGFQRVCSGFPEGFQSTFFSALTDGPHLCNSHSSERF